MDKRRGLIVFRQVASIPVLETERQRRTGEGWKQYLVDRVLDVELQFVDGAQDLLR